MKYVILISLFILCYNISFSQDDENHPASASPTALSANATASITVGIGVSVSTTGSNTLNFGDIYSSGSTQIQTISNQNGQKFLVQGNPGNNVIITFNTSVTLDNSLWVAQYGGTSGTMQFTLNPLPVHTLANSNYVNPVTISSGSSVVLTNVSGVGVLYVWAGGQLTVNANQPAGDYNGVFNINVSY